jgi:putative Mg2+ transporter-C (MgtC) family protein
MAIGIELAAPNLAIAMVCGALIGSERQVRGRLAGLRTNALVALGAASFVVFAALFPDEVSPTRVAAQIVSGIGFLGAGIIFRDGMNVHGLNTAATLWCSASVGMLAGAGAWAFAALMTGLVVFVNLGLRPLVKWIKRKTRTGTLAARLIRLSVTSVVEREGDMRSLVLRVLPVAGFKLVDLAVRPAAGAGTVDLVATLSAEEGVADHAIEQVVALLAAEVWLQGVQCTAVDEG